MMFPNGSCDDDVSLTGSVAQYGCRVHSPRNARVGRAYELVPFWSIGPIDGTYNEPAASGDHDDRDALQALGRAGKGVILDELCAMTRTPDRAAVVKSPTGG